MTKFFSHVGTENLCYSPIQITDGEMMSVPPDEICQKAQTMVTSLYEERGAELLHFALGFVHDEDLAKEGLQEAFMRYFVALCEGQEIASPRAWVYRVLHNYLLDRIKAAHVNLCAESAKRYSRQDQQIEQACFQREVIQLLRTMLTVGEYKCLSLRAEGLQYREIATKLNLTTGTVGALISRALGKLRRSLAPIGGEAR